ncbi:MAG: hypothetical protein ABI351_13900 [Herbaspirillum sp.]
MIDMGSLLGSWYRQSPRENGYDKSQQVINPYDQPTELLSDVDSRKLSPFSLFTLDLSVAGDSFLINTPGMHFVLWGHDGSPVKLVNTTAIVNVWFEKQDGSTPFPAKHARGFSGPFTKLYLSWPAQANVKADFVVFKGIHRPWIDGEQPT